MTCTSSFERKLGPQKSLKEFLLSALTEQSSDQRPASHVVVESDAIKNLEVVQRAELFATCQLSAVRNQNVVKKQNSN